MFKHTEGGSGIYHAGNEIPRSIELPTVPNKPIKKKTPGLGGSGDHDWETSFTRNNNDGTTTTFVERSDGTSYSYNTDTSDPMDIMDSSKEYR